MWHSKSTCNIGVERWEVWWSNMIIHCSWWPVNNMPILTGPLIWVSYLVTHISFSYKCFLFYRYPFAFCNKVLQKPHVSMRYECIFRSHTVIHCQQQVLYSLHLIVFQNFFVLSPYFHLVIDYFIRG